MMSNTRLFWTGEGRGRLVCQAPHCRTVVELTRMNLVATNGVIDTEYPELRSIEGGVAPHFSGPKPYVCCVCGDGWRDEKA